jgi:hypothetical protein
VGLKALRDQALQQAAHGFGPQALGLQIGSPGMTRRHPSGGTRVVAVQGHTLEGPGGRTADGHHLVASILEGRRQVGVLTGKVLMNEQHLHRIRRRAGTPHP